MTEPRGIKCDDNEDVWLNVFHANNGDFYPEIIYKDNDGKIRRSPSPRISTSGGINNTRVLLAVAELYRAIEESKEGGMA